MLPLLQSCIYFVIRQISSYLSLTKISLIILKLSILLLDDLLNIDNISFEQMNDQNYPTELQLNKANSSDNELPVLDLIEVYKTMDNIDHIEKNVLFTTSLYAATRGHRLKFAKKKHRLKIRANSFGLRVIDS